MEKTTFNKDLLTDLAQDYVSQARATITTRLGLHVDDEQYDDMIEEEIMNMLYAFYEYEIKQEEK